MERITSVIFDWGGVLIDDPAPGRLRYCADALNASEEQLAEAFAKFAPDFHRGTISEDKFWGQVCGELSIDVPQSKSLWAEGFDAAYVERAAMFALAADLQRRGLKTAILSNTEKPAVEYFSRRGYEMFDCLIFSCDQRTRKPESRIYEIAIARVASPPEQIVFIDDDPNYTTAAKQAGLNTILFESIEQVKGELNALGVETS
ncbi:MAG: HAD family hydrolase [Planctomycetota bacterium]|jgi:putative hydrolase of the HAD superfamily